MKSIKEIEDMELLERVSMDGKIKVPDNLGRTTGEMLDALDRASELLKGERRTPLRRKRMAASIAAGLVLVAGIGSAFLFKPIGEPVDTFDDPLLAYVEMQRIFGRIGNEMKDGIDKVEYAAQSLEKPAKVMKKINQ